MNLNIFTDFCAYWWLAWLLPFLLGLLLGWLIWGRWIRTVRELEDDLARANSRINDLQKKLNDCNKEKENIDREARDYKHQLSTAKAEISSLKTSQTSTDYRASITPIATSPEKKHITNPTTKKDKYAKVSDDNLQIIEGIGPKMEQVLKENGIKNLENLSTTNAEQLRTILDKYGDKYRIIDPTDWTQQARLANNKKWDDLIRFQKADGSDSKAEKMFVKMGIIKAFQLNDLKAIEGIGPKIAELLNNNGINTWKALAESSVDSLKNILDSQGSKYALADPKTWPTQAQMAADGEWDKLEEYQDFLNGGKDYS